MPQMAPINWLSLFIIFSISFMIFCVMNYYSYNPSMPKLNFKNMNKNISFNWKW
uniref:ATP synthase complex subunit 8 n=1 Tax=Phaonia errans TaxID=1291920 RepID=A0A7U3NJR5_9MUSC|nr:ATP synthase F0 subunit 8 [Phaonia errans]